MIYTTGVAWFNPRRFGRQGGSAAYSRRPRKSHPDLHVQAPAGARRPASCRRFPTTAVKRFGTGRTPFLDRSGRRVPVPGKRPAVPSVPDRQRQADEGADHEGRNEERHPFGRRDTAAEFAAPTDCAHEASTVTAPEEPPREDPRRVGDDDDCRSCGHTPGPRDRRRVLAVPGSDLRYRVRRERRRHRERSVAASARGPSGSRPAASRPAPNVSSRSSPRR